MRLFTMKLRSRRLALPAGKIAAEVIVFMQQPPDDGASQDSRGQQAPP